MILVTGGAGFIGSNLVAGLEARKEFDIAVVDRFGSDDKWRNLRKHQLAHIIPIENLLDFVGQRHAEIDTIFHMGAISSTTETNVDLIVANNWSVSVDLWELAAAHNIRLIYASSAATYGDGANGFDDDMSANALSKLLPLNAYGWSKHIFDRKVVQMIASGHPAPPQWVGLKFFNVYGPNELHKGSQMSVVPQFRKQILNTGMARLFKSHRSDFPDGGQLRDFVYVDDVVSMMLWLLDNPHVNGLFNAGSGQARSFLDMARAIFVAMGKEPHIEFVDMPEAIRDRYQYFTQARMGRLRSEGYSSPPTPLETGVKEYISSYLDKEDPYR